MNKEFCEKLAMLTMVLDGYRRQTTSTPMSSVLSLTTELILLSHSRQQKTDAEVTRLNGLLSKPG
jgi:hypothetical protein